ncbi:hypothetical protein H2201_007871 [Coniosporium apollinis]|uniref:NmrA-like domain-containing protein n=1 Tax=Coniosporium apollinis TaxID=61459 RepID=A0ABQ9NK84_9PEZI|nr:hypothetical protein H2201_007871 [Coniosporium apollinis]
MPRIINITLAGTTGIPGRNILAALLTYPPSSLTLSITVLKRTSDAAKPSDDPRPHTIYVDYTSPASLTSALTSTDVLISALHAEPAPYLDGILLSAAIEASGSVVRKARNKGPLIFISGYTLDVLHPSALAIANEQILGPKIDFARRLEREAEKGGIGYSTVVCAGFLDYILAKGYAGLDFPEKKARLFNKGEKGCTGCTLDFVGQCVVEIVRRWFDGSEEEVESVRNRRVRVAEVRYTGHELLELAQDITGERFDVEQVSTDELFAQGKESLERGEIDAAIGGFISKLAWDGEGAANLEQGLAFGLGRIERKSLRLIVEEAVEEVNAGSKFKGLGR